MITHAALSVLTFGSYEMYKKMLMDKYPNAKPALIYAAAAILGDLTGSGWLCPTEVVKQQLQAGMFSTTAEAVRTIWNSQGFAGFYQGYWGGIARDVPFRVAQLTSYELTKAYYLKLKKRRLEARGDFDGKVELSTVDAAACGAIAGTFSAAITTPLDKIKTLLMTNAAAYGGSVTACAAKIFHDEGLIGFAAGLIPRVAYIAPSVVIFFIAYEKTKQYLSEKEREAQL